MRGRVGCVICGEPHRFSVLAGLPQTWDSPAEGPEIDWGKGECSCHEHPAVDALIYWELMTDAAFGGMETG